MVVFLKRCAICKKHALLTDLIYHVIILRSYARTFLFVVV